MKKIIKLIAIKNIFFKYFEEMFILFAFILNMNLIFQS